MQTIQQFSTFREDFARYLFTSNLVEEENLEVLKNLKIAISGSYLIHNIIRYGSINLFQGFSKYQLSRYVKRLHECFQKHNIRTMVVFEGIIYNKDPKSNSQDITAKVKGTWQKILEDPKDPEIAKSLNELSYYFFTETEITNVLDEFDIEYIHAPYFSISQLKWFADYSYAHLVCCGLEGIPFNMNNIIFDFDLTNSKFYYLDFKKLYKATGLDHAKLISLFLIHGYNPNLHTFIPVNYLDLVLEGTKEQEVKENCFEKTRAQLATNVSLHKILEKDDLVNTCHALKRKLEYNLVFNSDCEVNLVNSTSYDTINDSYGPYFPPDVYVFFVYNLIDRELIDSIANANFIVRPPLSDSAEYHHHIDTFYKTMLEKIVGIFTSKLNTKLKNTSYQISRFYFSDRNTAFTPREYKPAKFILKQSFIDKEKTEQPSRNKKIRFCKTLQHFTEYIRENVETKKPTPVRKESLDFVLSTKLSPLTKIQKNNSEDSVEPIKEGDSPDTSEKSLQSPAEPNLDQPQTSQEILSYLYLSFLEMYDYVSTSSKNLMVIGAALRKCDENFEESLVMLLELMKPNLCLINGREFNNSKVRKFSTEAAFNTADKREHNDNAFYQINLWKSNVEDDVKEEIVLISRVFALINASISSTNADSIYADYDYDLCQYLGVLKHVQKILRFSFQSLMLNTYFTHCSKKDIKVFLGLKKHFPFRNNLNISLGIAIKKLLQTNETLAEFKEKNPHFINLEYNLKAGYILWENVIFLLKYQELKGEHPVELLELSKKANELLMKRFKELRLLESDQ